MLVLLGKTASGKTTLAKELEMRGYKRVITYTTRPMRDGEVNGVDYHFVTPEKFNELKEKGLLAEYVTYNASFGECSYGSLKEDYINNEKSVIILNPYGLKMIKEQKIPHTSVYLNIPDIEILNRLSVRGDSEEEIVRRMKTDEIDFKGIYEMSNIRLNKISDVQTLANELEDILEKLEKLRF